MSRKTALDARIEQFKKEADELAEELAAGIITLGTWEELFRQLIKRLHIGAAVIAKYLKWQDMTTDDWKQLPPIIKLQWQYAHRFSRDILTRFTAGILTLAAIKWRSRLYGDAARYTATVIVAGSLRSQLPWIPRDGSTRCLNNCRCYWDCEVLDTTGGLKRVRCVWRLRPAEHCQDCIPREGYVATAIVPESENVPRYIGGW